MRTMEQKTLEVNRARPQTLEENPARSTAYPPAALLQSFSGLFDLNGVLNEFTRQWHTLHGDLDSILSSIDLRSRELDAQGAMDPPASPPSAKVMDRGEELLSICESTSGKNLRKFVISQLSDVVWLRREVPAAIACAPDPAKLVFGSLGRFYLQGRRAYDRPSDDPMVVFRRACILILEFYVLSGCTSMELEESIEQNAEMAALSWRSRLINEGGLQVASAVDALGLVLFVGSFGIPQVFGCRDLYELLRLSNLKKKADVLRNSAILCQKMPVCMVISNPHRDYGRGDHYLFFNHSRGRQYNLKTFRFGCMGVALNLVLGIDTPLVMFDIRSNCANSTNVTDIINEMLSKEMNVEAVELICAFELKEKHPPVPLIVSYLQKIAQPAKGQRKEGQSFVKSQLLCCHSCFLHGEQMAEHFQSSSKVTTTGLEPLLNPSSCQAVPSVGLDWDEGGPTYLTPFTPFDQKVYAVVIEHTSLVQKQLGFNISMNLKLKWHQDVQARGCIHGVGWFTVAVVVAELGREANEKQLEKLKLIVRYCEDYKLDPSQLASFNFNQKIAKLETQISKDDERLKNKRKAQEMSRDQVTSYWRSTANQSHVVTPHFGKQLLEVQTASVPNSENYYNSLYQRNTLGDELGVHSGSSLTGIIGNGVTNLTNTDSGTRVNSLTGIAHLSGAGKEVAMAATAGNSTAFTEGNTSHQFANYNGGFYGPHGNGTHEERALRQNLLVPARSEAWMDPTAPVGQNAYNSQALSARYATRSSGASLYHFADDVLERESYYANRILSNPTSSVPNQSYYPSYIS
ncbi:hypothetical protein ZIOFF_014552 [Zingiber officinale]|uniref:FRIGIDA-like protein n=1 Tax=Zingiber officinale TaxID=94328 RepID=A0A8J5I0P1_ZINOF|nr:hypothetical protein ZIOFF_014552 [Zingiber officinale]